MDYSKTASTAAVCLAVLALAGAASGQNSQNEVTATTGGGATGSQPSAPASTAQPSPQTESGEGAPEHIRTDYLTFATGAVPISVGGSGAAIGADFEEALKAIDGGTGPFTLNSKFGDATTATEFVYELPALTTFDRFAVPDIMEKPSPSQTFVKGIEILGSTTGPDSGFERLASATLSTHQEKDQVTEIPPGVTKPVRWVKLRLAGGIQEGAVFFEFSDIIGNGIQEPVALVDHFTGVWRASVNFDYNSAVLRPESAAVLQELYEGLKAETSATVVIEGYTSSEGSDQYNQALSEKRAQAVVDDLVRRGIDGNRITAAGKGESEPIAGNETESGRSLNRRVEVECS